MYLITVVSDHSDDIVYGNYTNKTISGQTVMNAGLVLRFIKDTDALLITLSEIE